MIPVKVYNILIDLLPMIILFSVVMVLVKIVSVIYNKEKIVVFNEIKNLFYLIYCFALFQLVTTSDFSSFSNNFIPFHEITRYQITSVLFIRNIIGNIVLFIPFGFIISDMIKDKIGKSNIIITSFICLFTSFTIETIQMFIGRSFDIDDIILNFIGSILGFIIFKLTNYIYHKLPKHLQSNAFKLFFFILTIVLILIVFIFTMR